MKAEEVIKGYDGAVRGERSVVISATKQETDELRAALAVVERFKKVALQAAKVKEKDADWTMLTYAVKTDKVIVKIEDGACG
jgi:protein tyrosine phosphatase